MRRKFIGRVDENILPVQIEDRFFAGGECHGNFSNFLADLFDGTKTLRQVFGLFKVQNDFQNDSTLSFSTHQNNFLNAGTLGFLFADNAQAFHGVDDHELSLLGKVKIDVRRVNTRRVW